MLLQDIIGGELLLSTVPSEAPAPVTEGPTGLFIGLVVATLLASVAFLPRFLSLVPLLFDSLFRARGSVTLESSVRYGNDRRLMGALLAVPALLVIFTYRLYNPDFLQELGPDLRLGAIAGVFLAFLLLRYLLYRLLMPRYRRDFYVLSRNTAITYFILLVLLVLSTVGLLELCGVPAGVTGRVILVESALFYMVFFIRRAQILSLSCNHLRTFLYLCALEILPSSALVISAVLL